MMLCEKKNFCARIKTVQLDPKQQQKHGLQKPKFVSNR